MSDRLRFGIMGTGNIARQFAEGVAHSRRSTIAAVGSRTRDSAFKFAHDFSIPVAHASYEALLSDSTVEAIYLSLPNHLHHEWTLKSLAAGKHVLCEKPLARDEHEAVEMFEVAAKRGLLLVEAFMYRSHPQTHAVMEKVRGGAVGRLQMIRTAFCYRTAKATPQTNIRFDRSLAGGALMDVGCYCINFTRLVAGAEPTAVHAVAQLSESGVDTLTSAVLQFPNVQATFTCGMLTQADNTAMISGEGGYLEVPWPWKPPVKGATFNLAQSIPPRQDLPTPGTGATVKPAPMAGTPAAAPAKQSFSVDAPVPLYALEADDFAAAVRDAAAPALTPADSIGNMRVLDTIRAQIGLGFE